MTQKRSLPITLSTLQWEEVVMLIDFRIAELERTEVLFLERRSVSPETIESREARDREREIGWELDRLRTLRRDISLSLWKDL